MLNRASLRDIRSGKHLSQGYTFGETRIPRVMCSGNTRHGGTHITVPPGGHESVKGLARETNHCAEIHYLFYAKKLTFVYNAWIPQLHDLSLLQLSD